MNLGEVNTEKGIIRNRMFSRGKNYIWIFRSLSLYKKIDPKRAELLESYYYLMRYIDDIADGQDEPPSGFDSSEEYLTKKIAFSKHLSNPNDFADNMMVKSFESAQSLGIDISSETINIMESMLFDSKRKGKYLVFDNSTLDKHYDILDIRGCISGALKIMGEDASLTDRIMPLGHASRIYYDTRDIKEDIAQGFVNIPKEELDLIGISVCDLIGKNTSELAKYRSSLGLEKLSEYKMPEELNFLTKMTLLFGYEKPSRKYFNDVLRRN